MILQQTTTLSNGRAMPTLGLGTWFIEDGDAAKAVRDAAEIGYRHFDSAQAYGNEAGVGEGVRTCGVPREELFVTSKLAAEAKTYDEAVRAIDSSLTTSGLDHLDLMLIHSPQPGRSSAVRTATRRATRRHGARSRRPTRPGSSARSACPTSRSATSTTSWRSPRWPRWSTRSSPTSPTSRPT